MTGAHTLAARAALGGLGAGASLLLVSRRRLLELRRPAFDRLVYVLFAGSRLLLYGLVFFVLHIVPRGDIPSFYRPEALAVLAGKLPYGQFPSSYAPWHGYLDAAVLLVWNSPLALILFAILVEICALPLFLRLARGGFAERRVRVAALLYLASPVSLQFVTVDGQDNVLIALLLAGSALLLVRGRAILSGAVFALSIVLVKFLPLLFVPFLLMACRKRMRWLMGFLVVLVCGYLPFALRHLPLLYPLQFEGQAKTASDLPFLAEALFGVALPGRFTDAVLGAALVGVVVVYGKALREVTGRMTVSLLLGGCSAVTLTLLLLSKKSWPPYLMLVWFPICLLAATAADRRAKLVAFVGISWIAVLVHSMWATIYLQALGPELHRTLEAGQASAFAFLGLQAVLLGGYGMLLRAALRQGSLWLPFRRSNPEAATLVPTCAR